MRFLRNLLLVASASLLICTQAYASHYPNYRAWASWNSYVVILRVETGGGWNIGAGILIAIDDRRAQVITAQHLFEPSGEHRLIEASVFGGASPCKARLVHESRDLDLAHVELLDCAGLPKEADAGFSVRRGTRAVQPGDMVFSVGNGQGARWSHTPPGDAFVSRTSGSKVRFQSETVREGFSGAPLLDRDCELVGMITEGNAEYVDALSLEAILSQLEFWGVVPSLLTPRPTSSRFAKIDGLKSDTAGFSQQVSGFFQNSERASALVIQYSASPDVPEEFEVAEEQDGEYGPTVFAREAVARVVSDGKEVASLTGHHLRFRGVCRGLESGRDELIFDIHQGGNGWSGSVYHVFFDALAKTFRVNTGGDLGEAQAGDLGVQCVRTYERDLIPCACDLGSSKHQWHEVAALQADPLADEAGGQDGDGPISAEATTAFSRQFSVDDVSSFDEGSSFEEGPRSVRLAFRTLPYDSLLLARRDGVSVRTMASTPKWMISVLSAGRNIDEEQVVVLDDRERRKLTSVYNIPCGSSKVGCFTPQQVKIRGNELCAIFCTSCMFWGEYARYLIDLETLEAKLVQEESIDLDDANVDCWTLLDAGKK